MALSDLHNRIKSIIKQFSLLFFLIFIAGLYTSKESIAIATLGIGVLTIITGGVLFYAVLRIFISVEKKHKKGKWETTGIIILLLISVFLLYYFHSISYPYYETPYSANYSYNMSVYVILTICFSLPYLLLSTFLISAYKKKTLLAYGVLSVYLILSIILFMTPIIDIEQNKIFQEKGISEMDASYCQKISNPNNADYCFSTVATELKDRTICNSITNEYIKANCNKKTIVAMGDETLCPSIVYHKSQFTDACYFEIAKNKKDVTICSKIKEFAIKDACTKEIS